MPVDILFPELGESVHEGQISRWLKNVGDFVKEDEPIVEIMTDKVNTELPAPAAGYLVEITVPEGGDVAVFGRMGIIEPDEAKAKAALSGGTTPAKEPVASTSSARPTQQANVPASTNGRLWYTPVVRAIARENRIEESELATIAGSGQDGRVSKKDVEAYLKNRSATPRATEPSRAAVAAPLPTTSTKPLSVGADQEVQRLTGLRKMIADHMLRSAAIPVVSTLIEVDVSNLVSFRTANKDTFEKQNGVKLTYTPFFIKAITDGLLAFPNLNSSVGENYDITMNRSVHMGVAVSLGEDGSGGLIVPVIRDCHKKSLVEIARELGVIAKKARSSTLDTSDVQGGSFTLTNPGSYGATLGTPMINAPQAGIVGTYGIVKRPVIVNDMIAVRSMMNIVLTYDHRIVDGMTAGLFLQSLKKRLEGFDFYK